MVTANVGYVVGDSGIILKTTNGGLNWMRQQSGTSYRFLALDFVNENTGTTITWEGVIRRTTNGGLNWTNQVSPRISYNVDFINENTGMICGAAGGVMKTTNGGLTWVEVRYNGDADFNDICMIDSNIAYVVGEKGIYPEAVIFKTTNGGLNWSRQISNIIIDLVSVSFVNAQTGIAGGWRGSMPKTTNGGTMWNPLVWTGVIQDIWSIQFISENVLTCCGNLGIFRSTNGGYNWHVQLPTLRSYAYTAISFINESTGLSCCSNGKIFTTTNGGEPVGVIKISNSLPAEFSLCQNYPNPFNSETNFEFDVNINDNYKLEIYDLLGRKVEEVFNKYITSGKYRIIYKAPLLTSGVYYYKLYSEKFSQTKKFVLLK
jgi:photosystem II stability/assembly factor-like uncharacterized protein